MEHFLTTLSFYRRSDVFKTLYGALHIFLMALLILLGLTLYESVKSSGLNAQYDAYQQQLLQLKNEKQLASWMAENKARVDTLIPELSRSVSQPELMQLLIKLARKSRVTVEGFTFDQLFSNQEYTKYQVVLTLSGHYPDVKTLMSELVSIRGYTLINQVQLKQLDRDLVSARVSLVVTQL